MTVKYEEIEPCKIKIDYSADPSLVEEKKQEAVRLIRKSGVKLPGFRMGKATDLAIRVQMKDQIDRIVTKELVSEAYDEALFETKMKPIGMPDVRSAQLKERNFTCEMTLATKPEFELQQYKGFQIPKPHLEQTVSQLAEEMIQNLRMHYGDVVPYEETDFVQDNDKVTMDVKALIEGQVIDSLSQEGLLYHVGYQTVPEFDKHLYGMKSGEDRKFCIKFPDEQKYATEVRGKKVDFEVTVHMGTKTVPHPLDDELAKKVNFKTYNELQQHAEGQATAQLQEQEKRLVRNQVMKRVMNAHDFDIPNWLVLQNAQSEAASKGIEWDSLSDDEIDTLLDNSHDDVKMSLILDEVRENEPEAVLSDQELIEKLRERLTSQGQNANALMSSAAQSGHLAGILAALKDELTMNWIVDQSQVLDNSDKQKPEEETQEKEV